jgi:hypothetical protein
MSVVKTDQSIGYDAGVNLGSSAKWWWLVVPSVDAVPHCSVTQ